jgi:hypothetical protein
MCFFAFCVALWRIIRWEKEATSSLTQGGSLRARSKCLGGIDVDAAGVRDFTNIAGAQGTVLDMFDESQYRAFHGKAPPKD